MSWRKSTTQTGFVRESCQVGGSKLNTIAGSHMRPRRSRTPTGTADHRCRQVSLLSFNEPQAEDTTNLCQDPTNPRKRLYRVFQAIEDSTCSETAIGSAVTARGKVPKNKAIRETMSAQILSKVSSMDVMAGSSGPAAKAKAKAKSRGQKEKTEEQKARMKFDKDLAQSFGCNPQTHTHP